MSTPSDQYRLSPQQAHVAQGDLAQALARRARLALLIEGALDLPALAQVIHALGEQHEILRTRFVSLPGTQVLMQQPQAAAQLHAEARFSLAGIPAGADGPADRLRWSQCLAGAPFPPSQALQAWHVRFGPERHGLFLDLPLLCADPNALLNLAAAISTGYHNGADTLGEAGVQYADVAEIFHQLLEAADTEAGSRYWRAQDLGPARAAALPWLLPPAEHAPYAPPIGVIQRLDTALYSQLQVTAAGLGCSVAAMLLACWQALLLRLSGQNVWTVAAGFDGRTYAGLESALGLFERYLPLPLAATTHPDIAIGALSQRVAAALGDTAEWQDYFDPTALDRTTSASQAADFPLTFDTLPWPAPVPARDTRFTVAGLHAHTSRFALKLSMVEHDTGLELWFHADPTRCPQATLDRLAERYLTLLAAAVHQPAQPLGRLPIVGALEQRQLAAWNHPSHAWPTHSTIHEQFTAQAERTPERLAVVSAEASLTYAELAARSNHLAAQLVALGVGPETRVGLCLERSAAMLVGVLGILKAGGAVVPLDPLAPAARLLGMAEDARLLLVLVHAATAGSLPETIRTLDLDLTATPAAQATSPGPANPRVFPEQLAYLIFTSGSTGRPKAVMIQHRSALNLVAALDQTIYSTLDRDAGLRVSLSAPLAFDAAVKQWLQLIAGHTVVVVPEAARPDAQTLCRFIAAHRLDVLDCTPAQLPALLDAGLGQDPACSPKAALVGGEAIDPGLWTRLATQPQTRFFNVYGPTECTVDATACLITPGSTPTIGRPLGNMQAHLLDAMHMPVPIGVFGELHIGGSGVGRGYAERPGLTAARFVPDPYGPPGARLYRTGDRARWRDDGAIEFQGRIDSQVKLRGYRIELGEIETLLSEYPAVAQAVVQVRELSGEPHLIAYFVPSSAASAAPDQTVAHMRQSLRARLPEYMVPGVFIPLAALPVNRNGKIDRSALPAPESIVAASASYAPPTNEIEKTLVTLWQEVLGTARVGIHDNFFDLGGHSLLMVRMHEQLQQRFGKRISMVELFRHPTVSALARYFAGAEQHVATQAVTLDERVDRQRQALRQHAERTKALRGKR